MPAELTKALAWLVAYLLLLGAWLVLLKGTMRREDAALDVQAERLGTMQARQQGRVRRAARD